MPTLTKQYFPFTGAEQTYTVPVDGWYELVCYGGRGGKATFNGSVVGQGGNGGGAQGVAYLKKNTILHIYVGGKGEDGVVGQDAAGGFNGGGNGAYDQKDDESCGAGGGATHIALVSGELSTLSNQRDKVLIVAGGGGGASVGTSANPGCNGGAGGGVTGGDGSKNIEYPNADYGKGGTQTTGNAFGKGQDANLIPYVTNMEVAGGGGGWFGGTSGVPTSSEMYCGGAGGGSGNIDNVGSGCRIIKGLYQGGAGGSKTNGEAEIRLLMPDINKLYLSPDGTAKRPRNAIILGDGTAHHINKLYLGNSNNEPELVWVNYEGVNGIVDAAGFAIWNMADLYVGVNSTSGFSGNVTNVEISDNNSTWHNVPEDPSTGYQIMNSWVAIPSSVITSIIGTPSTIYVRVIDGNTRYSTSIS